MRYPFSEIESKWQKFWEDNQVYKTDLNNLDKKLYHLNMFIYPSGAKLHTGHWYHYGPSDSWARYKKLKGCNVFEPMGYDAFASTVSLNLFVRKNSLIFRAPINRCVLAICQTFFI